MAVTKRTRYEVLRRDQHTCQYCGGKAPDVQLRIDHVEPVALGGSDKPDNLVAACQDCNAGKSSIAPDSPLVIGLSDRAAAYALGMVDKMTKLRASISEFDDYFEAFRDTWERYTDRRGRPHPLPADAQSSLYRWFRMGVPQLLYDVAVGPAMVRTGLTNETRFKYFAGVVWNMIDAEEIDTGVTAHTCKTFTDAEANEREVDAYEEGQRVGAGTQRQKLYAIGAMPQQDFLRHHIDNTRTFFTEDRRYGAEPSDEEAA